MTFDIEDYERAIVRIFDLNQQAIGTGFLVAPGYVLTCAHVVLQAIGIAKEEFAQYQGQPQETISLDFHILATGTPIEAKIVDWLPYSLEKDDIAALKLLDPEPERALPMPLVEVSRLDVENEPHSVYGFANSIGGSSDAYRPKTTVAGGRFQLCKFGDANDETIAAGFSGAPVWNQQRQCIIGMIATASIAKQEQQPRAYAIPTQILQPVLKKISAFYLHDVLTKIVNDCDREDKKLRLELAIETALKYCDSKGEGRQRVDRLMDLSIDRPPAIGWEIEGNLVRLAMVLAQMEGTPSQARDGLMHWVECYARFNFRVLHTRILRELGHQQIPISNQCQHLMVSVDPVEPTQELRISLWAIADRETYNPNHPPQPLVPERVLSRDKLPAVLRELIRQKLRKDPIPTIHLFVPRTLFDDDLEVMPCNSLGVRLGSEYPVLIRTNLKTHPVGCYYYDDWQEKWERWEAAFENDSSQHIEVIDCSLQGIETIEKLKDRDAAILDNCHSASDFFELIAPETALPVALWVRESQFYVEIPTLLDGKVKNLPDRIREERRIASKCPTETMLGDRLSLIWEDPKIIPPDMQFDPEAW